MRRSLISQEILCCSLLSVRVNNFETLANFIY
jgi:hypothetical protein